MYDIQGALRRLETAERLEALHRARQSMASAPSPAPEAPEPPSRPRHLAASDGGAERAASVAAREPEAREPEARETAARDSAARDKAAREALREAALREAAVRATETGAVPLPPPQPSAPATPHALPPVASATMPTPTAGDGNPSPYADLQTRSDDRSGDFGGYAPAAASGFGDRPRGETLLVERAPDQTARLDVSAVRADPSAPPPLRHEAGVTVLHGPLELPPTDLALLEPVATPTATVTDTGIEIQGAVVGAPRIVEAHVADAVVAEPVVQEVDDRAADQRPLPGSGSSAAAIADLLRHGTSRRLFFDR